MTPARSLHTTVLVGVALAMAAVLLWPWRQEPIQAQAGAAGLANQVAAHQFKIQQLQNQVMGLHNQLHATTSKLGHIDVKFPFDLAVQRLKVNGGAHISASNPRVTPLVVAGQKNDIAAYFNSNVQIDGSLSVQNGINGIKSAFVSTQITATSPGDTINLIYANFPQVPVFKTANVPVATVNGNAVNATHVTNAGFQLSGPGIVGGTSYAVNFAVFGR
jgi:hypothetical protein